MNIQLRDSKSLQAFLLAEAQKRQQGRKVAALPKAQLHPELQTGRIDGDGGGFVVSVEEDNQFDMANLEAFLPKPDQCLAAWTIAGPAHARIPTELVFTFDGGGKLVARTQWVADVTKLTSVVSLDHRVRYDAVRDGAKITFARASTEKPSPTSGLSDDALEDEAALLGVKYDKKASRETNVKRLAEAKRAREGAAA